MSETVTIKCSASRIVIRKADVCPHCRAVNSIRTTHGMKANGAQRVGYGYCRECRKRVTIREVYATP